MKLPQKPKSWIVGVVAVVVMAGVCGYWLRRGGRTARTTPQPGLVLPAGGTNSATNAVAGSGGLTNRLWPDLPIDLDTAESNYQRLAEAPGRDPFLWIEPSSSTPVFSPINLLKLRAIWRQSGSQAVVINDRVYLEGETIAGFKIERIDADQVWLRGAEKAEPLTFERSERPPPPPPIKKGAFPVRALFGAPTDSPSKAKS